MMYESIREWRDLEDGHRYQAGDKFPHDGRELPAERYAELCGSQNKAGFAVIRACQAPVEETPVHEAEPPQKATKGRKKGG